MNWEEFKGRIHWWKPFILQDIKHFRQCTETTSSACIERCSFTRHVNGIYREKVCCLCDRLINHVEERYIDTNSVLHFLRKNYERIESMKTMMEMILEHKNNHIIPRNVQDRQQTNSSCFLWTFHKTQKVITIKNKYQC